MGELCLGGVVMMVQGRYVMHVMSTRLGRIERYVYNFVSFGF